MCNSVGWLKLGKTFVTFSKLGIFEENENSRKYSGLEHEFKRALTSRAVTNLKMLIENKVESIHLICMYYLFYQWEIDRR